MSGAATIQVFQVAAEVVVSPAEAALALPGETQAFTATASDANGNEVVDAGVVWLSEDHTVATIDAAAPGRVAAEGTYCWGFNTTGQLGDGTTVNSLVPVRVLH